jgi:YVTN family beta-propeller protein
VIDTASNSIVANITLPYANPVSVTVSTDGSLAYVVLESASEIAVIATGTNTVKTVISPIGPYPFDVAVLPAAAIVGTGGTTPTCSFSLASSSMSMPSGGGTGSVMLNASSSSCGWTASSDAGWLTLTSPLSGSGGMNVTFSATSNLSSARTGHITAGGQTYTVNQAGAATTFTPIRVRCGGPQLTDSAGHVWVSDNASNYSVTNASIGNASPLMALYQTEAWSTGTLQYQYSVANGSRTVVLKFAESYMTASGQRQFNIVVNGTTYYASFDILGHTSPNTAYDVSIPVGVSNGQITIQLQSVKGPAKINAIEID